MSIYAHIKRCLELTDKDVASAIRDRRLAKALLDQLAKISRPGDGAPKLLLVFAKMATQSNDWIDGALRIEMVGDHDVTVVEVLSELGLGMHERVFPSFRMAVPLEEFARAVERVPHMIEPLTIATKGAQRLVLAATADGDEDHADAHPESSVAIGDDSLYAGRHPSRDKMNAVVPEAKAEARPETKSEAKSERAPEAASRLQPHTRTSDRARAVKQGSKSKMAAVKPRIISPTTGKTLRPAPLARAPDEPPPPSVRSFPKAPPLPRTEPKAEPKRAIVARVPLTKMAAPASHARGSRPAAAKSTVARESPLPPPPRKSRPAPQRAASAKPPPMPKGARPSKPPARPSKGPPPVKPRSRQAGSEPPDEESIDLGWDEKE